MRLAFNSLTTRGRAFLSSGVTAAVCAVFLGLDDLGRIGVLLVTLPILSAFVATRGRHRLGLARTADPRQFSVGGSAEVRLSISNEGLAPTGLLLLEEYVPYALGECPRFVIDRMGSKWHRTVSYRVRSDVRGRFEVGPVTVRVTDPFGLVELDRTFHSTSPIVVTPRVENLPAIPLTGVWAGSGDNRPRDFAGGSAEDVTVREYRRGDDLRRVHWRSSAHAGELMVRREEQPWQSRATLFLDNRTQSHRGAGANSTLEYAITLAASIAMHLTQRGFRVRLVTADPGEGYQGWHEHGGVNTEAGPLLESLAVLTEANRPWVDTAWLNDSHHAGLLVAVLGTLIPEDRALLRRMQHAASSPLAVTVGLPGRAKGQAGQVGGPAESDNSTASRLLLQSLGWRATAAEIGEPQAAVWQRLGLTGRRASHDHTEAVGRR